MSVGNRLKSIALISALMTIAWFGIAQATQAGGPFAKACLKGHYIMSATGWEVSNDNTPFALSGEVDLVCNGGTSDTGSYTGTFFATYPGLDTLITCQITDGTYSINPENGAITSSSTLTGDACAFNNKSLAESGFLSDPKGTTFTEVETGQNWGDTISYTWIKTSTADLVGNPG